MLRAEDGVMCNRVVQNELMMKADELKLGAAYHCVVAGIDGSEKDSVIPLAEDGKAQRRFVLIGAQLTLREEPAIVHQLLGMSFEELDHADWDADQRFKRKGWQVWSVTRDEHGFLTAHIGGEDVTLKDFEIA